MRLESPRLPDIHVEFYTETLGLQALEPSRLLDSRPERALGRLPERTRRLRNVPLALVFLADGNCKILQEERTWPHL